MQLARRLLLVMTASAALACGGKDETTATGTSTGGSDSSGGPTTVETTDDGTSSTTMVTTSEGTSTSGATSSTGMPACETDAMSCGVSVDEMMSFCPDPPPDSGALTVEVLGPGQITITEVGYDSACGLTIAPVVKILADKTIFVSYEVLGQPMDGCICKYTISSTLSGVPSGTWKVQVGPFSQMVDVP